MTKTSVAFSGSGFKVPAHVGALQAIESSGHEIVELAGTSGGAILAAFYACGMSSAEMKELCFSKDWSEMLDLEFSALFRGSYCTGNTLYEFFADHTRGLKFKDVKMPLRITSSDVAYNQPFLFSQETTPDAEVALAVRASTSLPMIYSPVVYKDRYLVDGMLVNNIPVGRLTVEGTKKLGIQLHSEEIAREEPGELRWPWQMATRILDLLVRSSENTHIRKAEREGAEIIYAETGFADPLDTNMGRKMRQKLYDAGYDAVVDHVTGQS